MTWVIWRSHRSALLTTVLLAVAGCLVVTVLAVTGRLDDAVGVDGLLMADASQVLAVLTTLAPALAGAFLGAPLLAGDLERGTHVLLLTQAASRRRWATTALLLVGGLGIVAVTVVTAVLQPLNGSAQWYSLEEFSATGLLPLARTLSAVALGAVIGLLVRRVLAASVLTLAALRNVLVPPVLRTGPLPHGGSVDSDRDQMLDAGYTLAGGGLRPLGTGCTQDDVACLRAAGIDGNWVLVRPLELRWPMHWVEVGLHLVLTAGALALLFARLRRPLGR
ncbi:putative transmembrane transport protein [Pseudonocardia sp. Ae168_Ps1]|uniref:hypothetical protein n=1 Tax=unclassified Pseudonocardia TaxID=2619320 RepID=UPI00094B7255|nr:MULTISPECIES: hypothetical protein [unclassified Pseudonocardia]OLL76510.1 putative transmembrane transport protein [Pseudonocardia sp. Ae150A_Ps1]OLL82520.1 putative transmembrane transport protein [Pseudonocardia sp. Ae168_Ps1]OLL83366.1 putative transmembrane transport protein [Pseudonocardia sp. Ae263_Ps1]OLL90596.1 putative transmembrane transport protein [Pseudonocardia sp. Ae356_Ps1]